MTEESSRKLAVLLHADVINSTAFVQINETVAHERFQDVFRRFSKTIPRHNGITHEIRGDALVAEFSKASDAVSAALEFQSANHEHNNELKDEIRPALRIGIAMGEVVIADNTVTGEGIVLAQRLEQLAEPGGICIQSAAYETIPKRFPFEYRNLGDKQVKGFDEPVRVYAVNLRPEGVMSEPQAATHQETSAPDLPEKPSIAVLPFTNMSSDPEQEYFSDGITEDIITALSKISALMVIARNSTFVYKGKAVDVKQVGRDQGVRYVLEGSVRKSGNRVRITAQLIDTNSGHHKWAEHYDRDIEDIFAVQDEITKNVTVALQVKLTVGEQARVYAGGTNNIEAWECVVRGKDLMERHVKEDNLEAQRLLEQAVRLDPKYVTALTYLGWAHWEDARWGWGESPESSLEKAFDLGRASLELDKDHADSYALLGFCYLRRGDLEQALAKTEKAVALAPNHAYITAVSAGVLRAAGRLQDAVWRIERAMRLCPICPAWYLMILGSTYHLLDNQDAAVATLKEAAHREPESIIVKPWLLSVLIELGEEEEAKIIATDILRIEPGFSCKFWALSLGFKDPAVVERLSKNLCKAGLPE